MPAGPTSPLIWDQGVPRSALYGDIYYSLEDGLAESRAVFLAGCGLPQAWQGRTRFVVAELGFGSGLNIAALLELWSRTRPAGGQLHIFSIEAHPLSTEEANRILGAWPELVVAAEALTRRWPGAARGFHRVDLAAFGATLDLAILPVETALAQWSGRADAWFLDGFSPAANPAMWTDEVLSLIAARSAPGARAATFTVAGQVRRGLEAAGFAVDKRPGHGRKRERLEAVLPGKPVDPAPSRVAIIGGGIAGAACARALRAHGVEPAIFTGGDEPAASGNPAALVTPALDAGGGPRAAIHAQAFARAGDLYRDLPQAIIATGAIQIEGGDRDAARFETVAGQDLFEPGSMRLASASDVAAALAEPKGPKGLVIEGGLVVEPGVILEAWLGAVDGRRVTAIDQTDGVWRLTLAGGTMHLADAVVLACGWGLAQFAPKLALQPVRGQASMAHGIDGGPASAFGAYVIPTRTGILFGATHDRDVTKTDVREADHDRNRLALAQRRPNLAGALEGASLQGRAAIRVASSDRMPIAGKIAQGLWALGALGSRGFTTAPLLAEHIAAQVMGAPSPLPTDLARLVDPARLTIAEKRDQPILD